MLDKDGIIKPGDHFFKIEKFILKQNSIRHPLTCHGVNSFQVFTITVKDQK